MDFMYCVSNVETNEIFQKYGVEGEEIFLLQDKTPKYGVTGLWNVISIDDEEELWIGLNRFKNIRHCEEVMKKFDNDPETEKLYNEFVNSVSAASRVIRGEFEKIV